MSSKFYLFVNYSLNLCRAERSVQLTLKGNFGEELDVPSSATKTLLLGDNSSYVSNTRYSNDTKILTDKYERKRFVT